MQVVARLLECALRFQALVLFPCMLDELLGRTDRLRGLVARADRGAFVGCALGKGSGQRVEERAGGGRVRAQLLDLRLQPFDAQERLRDVGVAALELFGERKQRFHGGAGDGTRTRMAQRPPDFKSGASDQFRHPGAPSVAALWQGPPMTHDTIVALAVLGIIGQVLAGILILIALAAAVGARGPLRAIRQALWGYELWAAFVVAAIATGGSLFFSEIAHFVPCELCWYQRICMYPLSILTLFLAYHGDHRAARYLLPLPVVGAGVSIYHLLIENKVITEPTQCLISAPGGCATKWINEFGYITIPTLALTGFVLLIGFLALAAAGGDDGVATLPADA